MKPYYVIVAFILVFFLLVTANAQERAQFDSTLNNQEEISAVGSYKVSTPVISYNTFWIWRINSTTGQVSLCSLPTERVNVGAIIPNLQTSPICSPWSK
ncbi:hypothetical protein [Azomonas macrocytogenes]|uniref:Uncharacterized protein n=1 Tax=Azomonas macrocytogenes TaxID=69962 RepID=A0A839T7Q8_AZOMA|nr:hypothetical protein [Azomonas macrocytogenes]MBB3105502.1 hypothetical protein [Azomonas macrocytogenes]